MGIGSAVSGFAISALKNNNNQLIQTGAATAISAAGAAGLIWPNRNQVDTTVTYTNNSLFKFPYDLPNIDNQTFCIMFNFFQYDRPSILNAPTLNPLGTIALPIPSDLLDITELSYSEQGSGLMFGAGLEEIAGDKNSAEQKSNMISNLLQDVGGAAEGLGVSGTTIALNTLGQNLGTGQDTSNLAAKTYQMAGVAQNPFLSVLFNAPSFKRHIFSWTFIPENANDQDTLRFIINKFRYHSLPDVGSAGGGALLTYPDMCLPQIIPTGYMYDFKQCVVEGMSINFAPGDTPVFQGVTNAPAAIKLTIKLLEIEYWVKSDLTNKNNSNINKSLFGGYQS